MNRCTLEVQFDKLVTQKGYRSVVDKLWLNTRRDSADI
jgi:hypothetical protein